MRIYFFTNKTAIGTIAFGVVQALHPEHQWLRWTLVTPSERASFESRDDSPDMILSFLNPYVLPAPLLEKVRGRAYNIHPAPPTYPGRDSHHFAYYEGTAEAGATLHAMTASVDSGPIYDVVTTPFDRAEGVTRLCEQSSHLALALLVRHLPALLKGSIQPAGRYQWRTDQKRSRLDFLEMCRITPSISAGELERRLAAFHNPDHWNVHVELHGRKFFYVRLEDRRIRD